MMSNSGIMYPKESLILNISLLLVTFSINIVYWDATSPILISKMMAQVGFNLFEDSKRFKDEASSFNNLIVIEKKSEQLNQFVTRLLPRHVPYPYPY